MQFSKYTMHLSYHIHMYVRTKLRTHARGPHMCMYTQARTRPQSANTLTEGAHFKYDNESYHLVPQFDLLQLEASGSVYPEDPPCRRHSMCLVAVGNLFIVHTIKIM